MSFQIIRGDARSLPFDDASVDLVVTSPPYFGLRSYTDGGEHYDGQIGSEESPADWLQAMIWATREMVRVLKPTGSIFVNLGDKYVQSTERHRKGIDSQVPTGRSEAMTRGATIEFGRFDSGGVPRKSLMGLPWRYALRCIDELGLILRAELIWSKPNGLPESVSDRVRRTHETWFHFTVRPRYFAAVDEVRSPLATSTIERRSYHSDKAFTAREQSMAGGGRTPYLGPNPLGAVPSSVWEVPTQPLTVPPELGVEHFAAFPMEWPRRLILGWSPPGGTVLDPFGGTGTTALVAHAHGRHGISVDLSADYCRLAEWRCTDRGQLAAAMQVDKPEPVPDNQLPMFEAMP